jgi:hypothetical protein
MLAAIATRTAEAQRQWRWRSSLLMRLPARRRKSGDRKKV